MGVQVNLALLEKVSDQEYRNPKPLTIMSRIFLDYQAHDRAREVLCLDQCHLGFLKSQTASRHNEPFLNLKAP